MKTAQQLVDTLLESDLDNLVSLEQVLASPKLANRYASELQREDQPVPDEVLVALSKGKNLIELTPSLVLDMLDKQILTPDQILDSDDSQVRYANEGVYFCVADWDDVAEFIGDNRRTRGPEFFKEIVHGEANFHDNDYGIRVRDVWDDIDNKNLKHIQALVLKNSPEAGDDWKKALDDDVETAIIQAASDAYASAEEAAYYEAYTDAIEASLGPSKFIGSKLTFFNSYADFRGIVGSVTEIARDYGDEPTHGNLLGYFREYLREKGELKVPNTERISVSMDEPYFNERLGELLNEI